MRLPDFLEADLKNLKRTNNSFQRFHKFIHYNLSVLRYTTVIFFASAKATGYKTNKIDKNLYEKFTRPTEGIWLNFLELLLSTKAPEDIKVASKKIKSKLDGEHAFDFNQMFDFLMGTVKKFV